MSSLARSALQTGRVCLDVYLEDVSRLGAPTCQLLVALRRVIYRLLGRAVISETRADPRRGEQQQAGAGGAVAHGAGDSKMALVAPLADARG